MIYCIDLFCGAGGTTTGVERARINKHKVAKVIYCINHDTNAIASHKANHPKAKHAIEDIRTHKLDKLKSIVSKIREKDKTSIILLWASLECTNFSKAKGGLPRDADSRTLAEHLFRYFNAVSPEMVWIENVEEFMSWGPLDDNGKPISRCNGTDYLGWVNKVKEYGYDYAYKILNSADYGAYTSRKRLFIQFNKPNIPTVWPEPTHAKKPEKQNSLFGKPLKKWKAVKEVLDLTDSGKSIFGRRKPLSEKTLERIYAGLVKFVAGGKPNFILKYISNDAKNGDGPARTLTQTAGNQMPVFVKTYHGNGNNVHTLEAPCPTIPAADTHAIVFIDRQYGNGLPVQSINEPAASITTVPKLNYVAVEPFIDNFQYSNQPQDINKPCPTLVASRRYYYLLNPQWGKQTRDIENPCFTLIARMDKTPPYIVATEHGYAVIEVYDTDSPAMVKIKEFMAAYGIIDIKMRMLKVPELLRIQGFGDNYKLVGNQEQQKKYIGNSVVPEVVRAMIEATSMQLFSSGYYHAVA